jgi:hypothetical protein
MPGLTQNEIVTEELAANELRFFALAGLPEDLVSQAGRLPVDRSEQTLGLNSSEDYHAEYSQSATNDVLGGTRL